MDNVVRYYWIVCDLADGSEAEYIEKTFDAAKAVYDGLNVVFKKMVACYYDRDETIYAD